MNINALNKVYRHRITVYILKIRKERYYNRGIKLYLNCKKHELNHKILHIPLRGASKLYVTDLTVLCFNLIRETITEFNAMLIESGNFHHGKDAMSYLTLFILKTVLTRYLKEFKVHVFEATKCDISLQLIGECLRIAFGHFNKLKWHGLYLEMYLNDHLFDVVKETLNLLFKDEINELQYSLLNDTFTIWYHYRNNPHKSMSANNLDKPHGSTPLKSISMFSGLRVKKAIKNNQKQQNQKQIEIIMPKSPGFIRKKSWKKHAAVAIDLPQGIFNSEYKRERKRMTIYITQSAQRV